MSRAMAVILFLTLAVAPRAATPIRVMLLDGESGGPWHKWQLTTPVLKKVLEDGGFQVDVVTAPPKDGDFSSFMPKFGDYRAVVLNYDAPDERWSDALKAAFDQYVSNGGGLVSVHAADNAFPGLDRVQRDDRRSAGGADGPRRPAPTGSTRTARCSPTRQPARPAATARASRSRSPCARATIRSWQGCRASGCTRATSCMRSCAGRGRA